MGTVGTDGVERPYRVRGVYDPREDHTRGLTVDICRAKIEELDMKIADSSGEWGGAAQMERWLESREFFQRHMERLLRKCGI
jgi:hypothetical protein